jgi:hypothetical protein
MLNDTITSLIIDLEIEVACLLDSFEDMRPKDLERIQDKLARLHDEYFLSSTQS